MKEVNEKMENLRIDDLKFHPKNPKKHDMKLIEQSINELGYIDNVVVDENNIILGGHGRVKALKKLGYKTITVKKVFDLTEEQKEKYLLVSNQSTISGGIDFEKLLNFEDDILDWSGLEKIRKGIEDSIYSKKIKPPIYEPTGEKPKIKDLFDDEKYNSFIEEIEKSNLDKELKDFFKKTASRFINFKYDKIAEFYAHESKENQELFERLALVIIDFNRAIEEGYVQSCYDLINSFDDEEEQ